MMKVRMRQMQRAVPLRLEIYDACEKDMQQSDCEIAMLSGAMHKQQLPLQEGDDVKEVGATGIKDVDPAASSYALVVVDDDAFDEDYVNYDANVDVGMEGASDGDC